MDKPPQSPAELTRLPALCAAAILFVSACGSRDTPEAEIRAFVADAEQAAEERDAGALFDLIANDYQDSRGNGAEEVRRYLHGYLIMHQSIHLLTRIESIELPTTGRARVQATVAMLGREAEAASAWDLAADVYEFDVTLVREGGEWFVSRAEWRPAGMH